MSHISKLVDDNEDSIISAFGLGKSSHEVCRGIVTADVLELGLSRGAIATRKLEGVMRDKEHEDLYWFGPLR